MIFPNLELENVVQESDKTRLDASKSYTSVGEAAITLVEIEPEAAAGYVDVTTTLYLDWQYSTEGTKAVTVRVTTDGAPVTYTMSLECVSATTDRLFSGDRELTPLEPSILEYVRAGRNSFLDVHRASQDRILTWLDEHRIWDLGGNKLTKEAITDLEEVNNWSKYMTLKLIFEGISNATDDIFHEKALRYWNMEKTARNRAALRLDANGDGETDNTKLDLRSFSMVRR